MARPTTVPRSSRRIRLVVLLLLGLIIIASAWAFVRSRRNAVPANATASGIAPTPDQLPVDVTTVAAISRASSRSVEVVGSLTADEEVIVSAQVAGELSTLSVDFGSFVKQGQVIAQIDRRDAQLKLAQAQAILNQTMARLGMKEGAAYDPLQNADVRVAKAQLDWARLDLDRATRLIENGDIARSVYDQSVINHQLAAARYQAALDQVQQQLALVEQQRAAVDLAKKGETDTIVRSPISGAVKEKHASRGAYLPVNGKIVTLVRLDPLRVRADIPEASAAAVRVGQMTSFTVDTFPGRTFAARVARIGPSLNEQTRALTIEAEFSNPGNQLRPGMFVRSQVVVNQNAKAILVPQKAVTYAAGISKVFIIDNGTATERLVKTGASDGDLIEILEGVAEGEVVASSNLDRLQTGTKIRR
ncbi:MAG: efflux RND transporter periplasmic adaptor subunit [Acidobacteriota bacterium]